MTKESEHEVTEQLITFLRGRSEHGQRKYGVALKPFDSRNTLMDALEESTDLSQYLQKEIMERKELALFLGKIATFIELIADQLTNSPEEVIAEIWTMKAKLDADCERSVPVIRAWTDEEIAELQGKWKND